MRSSKTLLKNVYKRSLTWHRLLRDVTEAGSL